MKRFVRFMGGADGKLIYINPERVTYLQARGNDLTIIWFEQNQSVTVQGEIQLVSQKLADVISS